MSPQQEVDAAIRVYVRDGVDGLRNHLRTDTVPVEWFVEAVVRVGANRRALREGRITRGTGRRDRADFEAAEAADDRKYYSQGGNR